MHLYPIPAGVGDHNGRNTLDDGVIVAGHMNAKQSMSVYHGVVFIDSFSCSTITHKMLSTSHNLFSAQRNIMTLDINS